MLIMIWHTIQVINVNYDIWHSIEVMNINCDIIALRLSYKCGLNFTIVKNYVIYLL